MIDEEHPRAIIQPAMDLHAVMMHFRGLSVLIGTLINHCERVIAKSPAMVV